MDKDIVSELGKIAVVDASATDFFENCRNVTTRKNSRWLREHKFFQART
jgi:hypothetical protein